jgi:hypothetical protein
LACDGVYQWKSTSSPLNGNVMLQVHKQKASIWHTKLWLYPVQ